MINQLLKILKANQQLSGYKIDYRQIEGKEVYAVRHSIDLIRAKKIEKCVVTIYRDFVENEVAYRGSCDINIYKGMLEKEIADAINDAYFAAGFVANRFYPLVKKQDFIEFRNSGNLSSYDFDELIKEITLAIIAGDNSSNGYINSFEVFVNKENKRLITSEGIDYQGTTYYGTIELVTSYQGLKEEIELYDYFNIAHFNPSEITARVKELLKVSSDRSKAVYTPNLGNFDVIVKDESVKQILDTFSVQTDVSAVAQELALFKVNDNVHKTNDNDLITLYKKPLLTSSKAYNFDDDGVVLQDELIIDNGKIIKNHGSTRYSHYLNVTPTGKISSNYFLGGKNSYQDFIKTPYLEIVSFSSLQVDELEGNFGGEIRLGYYFDGEKVVAVSGGSVSGNLFTVIDDLHLSSEIQLLDGYEGPKFLKVKMNVAGE